jgi:hypothetical protein
VIQTVKLVAHMLILRIFQPMQMYVPYLPDM